MPASEPMYVAGRFVAAAEGTVSASDAGVLLGMGVFETLRTYGGRPFRLAAHLARLRAGAEFLASAVRETDDEIAGILARLVQASGAPQARVRLTATCGPLAPEPRGEAAPPATLIVTARPLAPYAKELYERGATVIVSDTRANETDPTVRHKTTGYARNVIALRQAHLVGATEAILFNSRNRLAEGTISNVFVVREGRLLTPPPEEGLLAGITRAAVLELAAGLGIPAEERPVSARDVLDADEMFLTNSIMEVLPVAHVGNRQVGEGEPGPVTRRLAEAYRALVAAETGA